MTERRCPLCCGEYSREIYRDVQSPLLDRAEQCWAMEGQRAYYRCDRCHLIFVPPGYFLSAEAEKAEYDRHQNHPYDPGYRRFLSRLAEPLIARLAPGSRGLDFGSGPGPTLSVMLAEAGHSVAIYDPFYAENAAVFERRYDFITATEVVEHLSQPKQELDRLWGCLKPDGILGIMTKLSRNDAAFARWHYKSDPTHICFFSVQTFEWLAARWQAQLTILGQDVILIRRRSPERSGRDLCA